MPPRLIVASLVLASAVVAHPVDGHGNTEAVLTGGITTHSVAPGETWTSLAARFGVDATTIAVDNELTVDSPLEPGRELVIDNRHIVPAGIGDGEIVVNVPQKMLFYRDGDRVLAFPVGVGRATWHTPDGPFTVLEKRSDPAWHVPASIRAESAQKGQQLPLVVPAGPRNPLGRFWIGLSLAGIGIHGTPFPSSIYQNSTHGCIRVQGDSIEDLYSRVTIGTRGRIVYEPVLMAVSGDVTYLEVHRDVYRRLPTPTSRYARELASRLAVNDRIDWLVADAEIEGRAGVARRVSVTVE